MGIVTTSVALAMAAVLLWAGLEKARRPSSLASTLRELGLPRPQTVAALVIAAELLVALGLIVWSDSLVTVAGVVALATVFALAGLVAVLQDRTVRCGCFGPFDGGSLGRSQVAALPLWLAGASILWLYPPPPSSSVPPAVSFAVVGLMLAAARSVDVLRAWHEARGDRRSAQEMFVWLRR
jgi:DoxX